MSQLCSNKSTVNNLFSGCVFVWWEAHNHTAWRNREFNNHDNHPASYSKIRKTSQVRGHKIYFINYLYITTSSDLSSARWLTRTLWRPSLSRPRRTPPNTTATIWTSWRLFSGITSSARILLRRARLEGFTRNLLRDYVTCL